MDNNFEVVTTKEKDELENSVELSSINSSKELSDDTYNSIRKKVFEVILVKLRVNEDKLSEDSHFVNDLDADSLDQVEMIMAMEEAFNCEIKEEQAEKFTTVRSLIEYLNAETLAGKLNK